ncbi:hypothetical protein BURPS1710A_A0569 [Burkholderia pseudomallei 1710a]|uniref:Uncharacterized protein n=1 Tax=Burkholderia pseudomallei 1710a TaxID=320371 RepID=A0A0E1VRC7_BURPE|nr:hypothetical protein BURPS1710A_A0569 [Burkholderia pseudomallei 1710a]
MPFRAVSCRFMPLRAASRCPQAPRRSAKTSAAPQARATARSPGSLCGVAAARAGWFDRIARTPAGAACRPTFPQANRRAGSHGRQINRVAA